MSEIIPANALLLRSKNFTRFLISRALYGLCVTGLPPLLVISAVSKGGTAASLGAILGVGCIPALLGAFTAPKLLQKISQGSIFIFACILWMLVCGSFAIASQYGFKQTVFLMGVSFILELVGSIFYPSIGAYLPQLVPSEQLRSANSMRAGVSGLVGIIGPVALTTEAVVASVPVAWLTIVIIVGLALVFQLGLPSGDLVEPLTTEGVWHEIREGWRSVSSLGAVTGIILFGGVWHILVWSTYMVAGPIFLERNFGNLSSWGWFEALFAAGSIVGGFFGSRVKGNVIVLCIAGMVPHFFVVAALMYRTPIYVVALLSVLSGFTLSIGGVLWVSWLQENLAPNSLPIVFAYDYMLSEGLAPLGYLLMPLMIGQFGLMGASLGALAVAAVSGFFILLWSLRNNPLKLSN